jgi:hypothetical protein
VEIERWSLVNVAEAVGAAGAGALVVSGNDVTFALGSDTVVIVVESGDRPRGSGIRTAVDLTVVGPFSSLVEEHFIGEPRLVARGFVRLAKGCVALGTMRLTERVRRHGRLDEVKLYIETPLPYELLDRVRPVGSAPEQPLLDWLGLLPADPLAALERFVAGWYADVVPVGDRPAAPGALPWESLRVFHRAAAGRSEVYGASLHIYAEPAEARNHPDGMVAFGQESDGVFTLLADPAKADPTVYYDGLGEGVLAEHVRLSDYLMLFALAQASMAGRSVAWLSQTRSRSGGSSHRCGRCR